MTEAAVFIGVEVKRSMFFEGTGVQRRSCANGHEDQPTEASFCNRCGARVRTKDVERPTAAVVRWAEQRGKKPEQVWEELFEARHHRDAEAGRILAIHEVTVLKPTESHDRQDFALGFQLVAYNPYSASQGQKGPRAIDPAVLTDKTQRIVEMAVGLGLLPNPERAVRLFLTLYIS